jgi:hypothetical protein
LVAVSAEFTVVESGLHAADSTPVAGNNTTIRSVIATSITLTTEDMYPFKSTQSAKYNVASSTKVLVAATSTSSTGGPTYQSGAVAGIGIGSALGAVLVFGFIGWIFWRRKKVDPFKNVETGEQPGTSGPGEEVPKGISTGA